MFSGNYFLKTKSRNLGRYIGKIKLTVVQLLLLVLVLPLSVYLINQKTDFIKRAYMNVTGKNANLIVDLIGSGELRLIRPDLAQGGEEKGGMFANIITQVRLLQPEYIRIDHMYDFYDIVNKDGDGSLRFNWTLFDQEIRDIQETGAKPFLSLSYMPPSISSGNEVDIPYNWNDWREIIRQTIEHVSGLNGLAIRDVYYEVWNEPDLFGDFKMGRGKDYKELYRYAALGASDAKNTHPYKFGGPATTGLYKAWFDGLLTFSQENNLRLDFYSWHRYSKYLKDYENDIKNVTSWLENYPRYSELELIVSESGFATEVDPGYDNQFSAIHTLGLYSTASAFDAKSNLRIFSFEVKDGPGESKYWGRWGLLTHESFGDPVPKARYRAVELMNSLKGVRVPLYGQGDWVKAVAVKDSNGYKILIVNYDPFGGHYENVPLQLVGLQGNRFMMKRTEFLRGKTEFAIEASGNSWKTEILMKPNTALLLEITPID